MCIHPQKDMAVLVNMFSSVTDQAFLESFFRLNITSFSRQHEAILKWMLPGSLHVL